MKKYGKIAYIMLILIIFIAGFCIYKVSAKNNSEEDINEKTLAEIKYLENEFQNLFNEINNIKFENYTISATNIEEDSEQSESSGTDSSQDNGGKTSEGSEKSSSETEQEEQTTNKQYELKKEGILTQKDETNWNQIKNDVEKIYTVLYSTTIDLYQVVENKEDITNFNKEYDNLTKAVKDEDKKETLKELSAVYDFLPKFVEKCSKQEKDKVVIKTKNYIFKAYSVLDDEQWEDINNNVNLAQQEFIKIVTDISNKENDKKYESNQDGSKYNINKAYIMINELKNSVKLKDKEVFLIKYKNLLEELENV